MALPKSMRRAVRTSNYLERANRQVKRRARAIGIFPNPASVLGLVGSLPIEENERWQTSRKLYYRPACRDLDQRRAAQTARTQQAPRQAT